MTDSTFAVETKIRIYHPHLRLAFIITLNSAGTQCSANIVGPLSIVMLEGT